MAMQQPSLFLKSCPKCGGDLCSTRDIHGHYISCLQCGFLKDIDDATLAARQKRAINTELPAQPRIARKVARKAV